MPCALPLIVEHWCWVLIMIFLRNAALICAICIALVWIFVGNLSIEKSSSLSVVSIPDAGSDGESPKAFNVQLRRGLRVECQVIGRVPRSKSEWRLNTKLRGNWYWALRERLGIEVLDNRSIGSSLQVLFNKERKSEFDRIHLVRFEIENGNPWEPSNEPKSSNKQKGGAGAE